MESSKVRSIAYAEPGKFEESRFEKIHNVIFKSSSEASVLVAREIAQLIKYKQEQGTSCVLGLATGSSPIGVYEELVRMHQQEGLSFRNVITFNLDEYTGMDPTNLQSYYYFMHQHLFDHIDIPREQVNIPDGKIAPEQIEAYCMDYEDRIEKAGGLDFQLLGIGRTGHIGFNEPGSHVNSATRLVTLNHVTRVDAAPAFLGIDNVPRTAITMGIGTSKSSRRIVLLGWGVGKSDILKKTIEGPVTSQVPATYLQEHDNTTFVIDEAASSELTRIKTPWLVATCNWTEPLKLKAVVWLSELLDKSILKLTDTDYIDHGMSDLLSLEGTAYELNIKMFNKLQHTFTGWPGGKPNADDSNRPERAEPARKKVIIFSPHPDDDVISMGGTFDRLIEQGHEVHVAYQTSGNIAVADDEAMKFARIARSMGSQSAELDEIIRYLESKRENEIDPIPVRKLKGLIRRNECYLATKYLGLDASRVHFLDMPFYETGTPKKNKLSTADVTILKDLINEVRPHQIYAAGDLADPHGTHKVCLDALMASLEELKSEPYMSDCWVWLYRGAWQEWEAYEIDMAVPMSPDQVLRKRQAIFFHQSQKDGVMYQGNDSREFWVRVEDRNRITAQKYNAMGLADYAAIEAFKQYIF
ncbi:MAG: glucosamine-6-phosphate deaminase [Bacteroidota bacterium]